MDKQEKQLLAAIEELRHLLHTTAEKYGIHSPETIQLSQLLDKKLNEYDKIKLQG